MSTWDDKPNDYEHALRIIDGLRRDLAGSFTYDQYHAGCDAIRNERNRAQDEAGRLRAALKPFAYRNEQLEKQWADRPAYQMVFFELSHGDFRRASAALGGSQQTPQPEK